MSERMSRREFVARSLEAGAAGWAAAHLGCMPWGGGPSGAKDGRWKIGCFTRPFDSQDLGTAFDAVAEAGYRHVGLMTTNTPKNRLAISTDTHPEEAGRIGEDARRRGLSVLAVYGGDIPVGESLGAGIRGLQRLLANCSACGAKSLLMGGTGRTELFDPYYRAVAACCDEAAGRGIEIIVKPHGGLNATGPQCRAIVEKVGHPNFRIWYDPGNIFYYSNGALDPVADCPSVDGLVTGMCVKDYLPPKNVQVTPGTGKVNFRSVFTRLASGGFTRGSLVVECVAPGDLKQTVAEARKAREFVETWIRDATPGRG